MGAPTDDPLMDGPLQFGAQQEDLSDSVPAPSAPPAGSGDSAFLGASAPPQHEQQHDPLAAPTAPPLASTQQQWQQQLPQYPAAPAGAYPHIPAAAAHYPISLGSPAGSSSLAGSDVAGSAPRSPDTAAAAASPSGPTSPRISNPELRIAVRNPQRHTGPSGIPGIDSGFVTFEVATSTSLPHFSGQAFSVRRRFKDVVSLSRLLPKLLHGAFLPARPERNLVEGRRMTDAFVEARRAALERYLNRLAAHPAVSRSEALRVWLEADGSLRSHPQWRALKPGAVLTPAQATSRLIRSLVGVRQKAPTPSEVVQPAAACRDVYRLLHENLQQLRGAFKHSPLSAEELALRNDTVLVEDAAAALHVALHRAEGWARASAARAQQLPAAAVSLEALATFEGCYASRDGEQPATGALKAVAQASQAAGAAAATAAADTSTALQPLRDHHAITPNVLGALRTRERQLLTVMTLRQDLENKRAALSAAQLTPASRARRVDALRSQVSGLEAALVAAEAEYGRQLGRNREELLALRASRGAELADMLRDVVRLQLAAAQHEAAVWQRLAAALPEPAMTTAYMRQLGIAEPAAAAAAGAGDG